MKVLGQSDETYIIEATKDEIANLQGVYSRYHDYFVIPKVGDEINIKPFYRMARECKYIQANRDKILEVINSLTLATDVIDFVANSKEAEQ